MEEYINMPDLGGLSRQGMDWIYESIPSFNFSEYVNNIVAGGNLFAPDKIFETVIRIFAEELYVAIKLLSVIIVIVLINAFLENLKNSFNNGYLNSNIVCVVLIAGMATSIFTECCSYAEGTANDLTKVMWAMLPVLMTLVAGSGYVTTSVATQPILLFMCNFFAEILTKILIPTAITYLAVNLIDLMSDAIELNKFKELLKKTYNFILGIVMTVFTGMLSISSFAGTAFDSVSGRGAKFAVSAMVPFVGHSISDAMSAVASASMLLKNAVGITGIVCMLALSFIPVVKVACTIFCIRIGAAVCEPVANKKTISVLTSVGDSLSMINAAVISVTVMMIISVAIVVGMCR